MPRCSGESRKLVANALADAETASIFLSTTKEPHAVESNGGLSFRSFHEALADAPPEPEWLWEGYLAPGSLTLLAGRPKVGKSTFAFALLESVLKGRAFLGRGTKPASALLLSEERHGTLAEKRERFNLNGSVDLLMRHEAKGTPWPEVVEQASEHCRKVGIELLIVDTWDKWTALKGDAENSAGPVLEALEPLQQAAGKGLTVLIISHQRKAAGVHGEAVRGSSALTGGVDVIVELERLSSGDASGNYRVLRGTSRYSGTPEELAAELTEHGYEPRGDTEAVKAEAERSRIREVLSGLDAKSAEKAVAASKVAEEASLSESSARRHLAKAHGR